MMGPTSPEPATEGKDLSGGFFVLKISNGSYTHRCRLHVAPYTSSGGSLLYVTPPSGLFSDAGPDVTAGGLMPLLQVYYSSDWTIGLDSLWQMVSGEPAQIFPTPTVASVAGTGVQTAGLLWTPESQMTLTTRDDHGHPFRFVLLSRANWAAYGPSQVTDAAGGTADQRLVHYLAQNGAVRSHAGNKLLAPMKAQFTINRRLRRAYRLA